MLMKIRRILKWTVGLVLVALIGWFFIAYWTSTNDCKIYAATPSNPMKAIVYCDYGLANLKLQQVEKPVPTDDQILVRVRAASVNPYDWHFIEGTPYIMRVLGVGLRKPKDTRLGVDFSGTVEAVGKNVTQFKAGDEVFGGRGGAFAEYVCPRATRAVALKPSNVTFEQAASVNIAGITALQALRDKGKVQPGQKVLINGASGGVGTFAVQIAKAFGAEVTGVGSTGKVDVVRSLGADHVLDYTDDDIDGRRYDVVLDTGGHRSLRRLRRSLTPRGTLVIVGSETGGRWLGGFDRTIRALLLSPFVGQKLAPLASSENAADLIVLTELIESGQVRSVVDRSYPLEEAAAAIRHLLDGKARGKVVVSVSPSGMQTSSTGSTP
jgi:NADPH:quinone reductase-like Zn-dependent oxidoreductase